MTKENLSGEKLNKIKDGDINLAWNIEQ